MIHHPQKIGVNMKKNMKPPPKPYIYLYTQRAGYLRDYNQQNEVRYDFADLFSLITDPVPR